MKASKLGLLLVILAVGAILETAWGVRGGLSIGPEGCRVLTGKFHGPSYTFESEQFYEGLAASPTLEIDAPADPAGCERRVQRDGTQ